MKLQVSAKNKARGGKRAPSVLFSFPLKNRSARRTAKWVLFFQRRARTLRQRPSRVEFADLHTLGRYRRAGSAMPVAGIGKAPQTERGTALRLAAKSDSNGKITRATTSSMREEKAFHFALQVRS